MRAHGLVVAFVLALIPALVPALRAATPGEPLSVEWTAHEGCPDVNEYWRGIASRSSRIRRATTGETAPRARIIIRWIAKRSVATFTLGGAPREIAAATCNEVVDALALMTVLALDPDALSGASSAAPSPLPTSSSGTLPPPSAFAWVEPSIAPPKPVSSAPPPPPRPAPTAPIAPAPLPEVPPETETSVSAAIGPQLLAMGAGAAYGASAAIEVQRGRGAVRLTVGHAESVVVRNERGPGARFSFETARLDVCPWSWGDTLRFAPCAGASLGALRATPEGVANPREQWRPWSAVHLVGRAEWRLSRLLGLELELGAVLPLLREDFVVDPDYFLYRPPALMVSSQLALVVHFP